MSDDGSSVICSNLLLHPRMSTRLMRLRQTRPGSGAVKDRDMEDTVQELEARVAMLESQKEVLQDKLSLAKQHIVDLGARTPYKLSRGEFWAKWCQKKQHVGFYPSSSRFQVNMWRGSQESGGQHRLLHRDAASHWRTPGQRWRDCMWKAHKQTYFHTFPFFIQRS